MAANLVTVGQRNACSISVGTGYPAGIAVHRAEEHLWLCTVTGVLAAVRSRLAFRTLFILMPILGCCSSSS